MHGRHPRSGFAIAELILVLAMVVMLVTLAVAIALGATRALTQKPIDSGAPAPANSSPLDLSDRNAG